MYQKKKISMMLVVIIVLNILLGNVMGLKSIATDIAEWEVTDDIIATLDENGILTISGTGDIPNYKNIGGDKENDIVKVVIKSEITSIGNYAFDDCENLKTIEFENNSQLNSIGDCAFCNCENLENIQIPSSVTSIGYGVFFGCENLKNIIVDKENKNYATEEGVLLNSDKTELICYPMNKSEKTYIIPDSVIKINSLAWICSEKVQIGKNVEEIDSGGLGYIEEINVNEKNENYSSIDGVLFNKQKTELIQYPLGSSKTIYTVPNSVTKIGDEAFLASIYLKEVNLSNNVEIIGNCAFACCINLKNIKLPNSVTDVGDGAFQSCSKLQNIEILNENINMGECVFELCTTIRLSSNTELTQEIEIPEIIKRAMDENDILYSNGGIVLEECEWSEDKTKIVVNLKDINNVYIGINSGILEYYCICIMPKIETQYKIQDEYIKGINPDTTIGEFKNNMSTEYECYYITKCMSVKKEEESSILYTGKKIVLSSDYDWDWDEEIYDIVVTGDLNGDGKMGDIDLLKLARYKAGLDKELTDVYLLASDVNQDDNYADDIDLLKMARVVVGLDKLTK